MLVSQTIDQTKTMSLTLCRDVVSGRWFVEQIQTRFGVVRHTISFAGDLQLEQAFSPEFAEKLAAHLPKGLSQTVIAMSGPVLQTATYSIEGLRVLAQSAIHGVQRVVVRIKHMTGQILHVLAQEHRPDSMAPPQIAEPEGAALPLVKLPAECLTCDKVCINNS